MDETQDGYRQIQQLWGLTESEAELVRGRSPHYLEEIDSFLLERHPRGYIKDMVHSGTPIYEGKTFLQAIIAGEGLEALMNYEIDLAMLKAAMRAELTALGG